MTALEPAGGCGFVFPGQGSQYAGMGRELGRCHDQGRPVVARASQASGLDIESLLFTGSPAAIADPAVAQVLVFVMSSVFLAELAAAGLFPSAVAGHSAGEYSALVACGSLEWDVAMGLVVARGRAMAAAAERSPGTMAAIVGLDPAAVAATCGQVSRSAGAVVVANDNSPRQVVVSGAVEGVQAVVDWARAEGALRAQLLPVGGAYHSPGMAPAAVALRVAWHNVALRPPRVPMASSITGELVTDIDRYRARLLDQVTSPVRWHGAARALVAIGCTNFVEVGPGRVLTGLGRDIARHASHRTTVQALADRRVSVEGQAVHA